MLRTERQKSLVLKCASEQSTPQNGKLACFVGNTRSFPRDGLWREELVVCIRQGWSEGSLGAVLGTTRDLNLEKIIWEIISNPFSPCFAHAHPGTLGHHHPHSTGTFLFHKPALLMPVGIEPQGYPRGFFPSLQYQEKHSAVNETFWTGLKAPRSLPCAVLGGCSAVSRCCSHPSPPAAQNIPQKNPKPV